MNEFDYKGWIGSILDNYTSTSEFPNEGSENTLYIVRDGGQAQLYVWDSETSAYIEFAGGGGGGGGADSWATGQFDVSGSSIDVVVIKNGQAYSGDISFMITAWVSGQGAPIGTISGTETISDGNLSLRSSDYQEISDAWNYINNITHYNLILFNGDMQNPVIYAFATWYNVGQHKPYAAPTTDGTYTLQVTVTNGTPVYSWA